jgi:hypothetical protein
VKDLLKQKTDQPPKEKESKPERPQTAKNQKIANIV